MPEWITKYWLEWVFGLMVAALTFVVRTLSARLKKQQTENQALRDGMKALLRRQIIMDCEQALREGFCPTATKDTIEDMYNAYHALGGNGVVTHLKAQALNVPTVKGD